MCATTIGAVKHPLGNLQPVEPHHCREPHNDRPLRSWLRERIAMFARTRDARDKRVRGVEYHAFCVADLYNERRLHSEWAT